MLRGLAVNYQDLKDFDGQLFSTLEKVLSYQGNGEADMELVFEYGNQTTCSNGENIYETNANRKEDCDLLTQYLLITSVNTQFNKLLASSWSPLDRSSWTCSGQKS
jgi:hypothetical protein